MSNLGLEGTNDASVAALTRLFFPFFTSANANA